jgi:ABC-type phosphate transport system substrate-binding protein
VLLGTAATAQPASDVYVLVVHPDNPTTSVTRAFASDAFLKRVTRWPDGQTIQPVDLPSSSPIRQRFAREVLGRSVPAVRSYWQQLIFSGRGVPPPELSDRSAVAYVLTHRGAIGYVPAGTTLGRARVLAIR